MTRKNDVLGTRFRVGNLMHTFLVEANQDAKVGKRPKLKGEAPKKKLEKFDAK